MYSKSILSVLLTVFLFSILTISAQEEKPDPDPNRFSKEIERFIKFDRQNAVPENGVLFAGSSSMRMWMTRESFPDLPVINRGFGGAHISDVTFFADKIVHPYKPKVILFYAGDNDVAAGKSAEQVLADYQEFTKLVWEHSPQTALIFVPIKPSLARWDDWPEMKRANQMIEEYSNQESRLHYADTATPMLGEDGTPKKHLFIADGLHLSDSGYQLWGKIVRPFIDNILGL